MKQITSESDNLNEEILDALNLYLYPRTTCYVLAFSENITKMIKYTVTCDFANSGDCYVANTIEDELGKDIAVWGDYSDDISSDEDSAMNLFIFDIKSKLKSDKFYIKVLDNVNNIVEK